MSAGIQTRWGDLWSSRWKDGAYRLRFELGGENYSPDEQPVPRALQAYSRAKAIADDLFGEACIGVTATYATVDDLPPRLWPPRHMDADDRFGDGFAVLRAMGFLAPVETSWSAALDDDDDRDAWLMRSFDLTGSSSNRDTLLWNAVVRELQIWPSSPDHSFLLHPTEAVLLHVYDDRGMDVIGSDAQTLRSIYETFDSWLLDYDRPRMQQVFA